MALPTTLTLEIVTPDRALVREEVDEVELPGYEGYFGVLPGHTPLLATLKVGELWYRRGSEKQFLAIAGGFVEVLPDRVTVLAQIAERAEDIDVARAEAARQRAEERLARPAGGVDLERARIAHLKSLIRLQVAVYTRTAPGMAPRGREVR
jgi:F-type H+-transporting ATPase subunit epsilon